MPYTWIVKPRDILLLLVLGAVWGASFMFIKVLLREMVPLTLVGYRLALGAVGLAAFFGVDRLLTRRAGKQAVPFPWGRIWVPALVLGFLNVVLPYVAITWGETAISSGDAAILNATAPLFTTVFVLMLGARAGSEGTGASKILGVCIGFAGVALLVAGGSPTAGVSSENAWLGHGAVLLASASYAIASLYARRAFAGLPSIYAALAQTSTAALMLLPFALATPPAHSLSLAAIGALLGIGLGGTALAYLLYFALLSSVGPTRTIVVTYLLPCTALIYGALLLGEPIQVWALGGMALVFVGIAVTGGLLDRRLKRREKPVPPAAV
ncbi:MAG: DMT family transporter [Chloroflexia bacterium]